MLVWKYKPLSVSDCINSSQFIDSDNSEVDLSSLSDGSSDCLPASHTSGSFMSRSLNSRQFLGMYILLVLSFPPESTVRYVVFIWLVCSASSSEEGSESPAIFPNFYSISKMSIR